VSADEWTPGERLAAIVAQEINDAPAEQLIKAATDDVLRGWAAKIRDVGTARGWGIWAGDFMDPDVAFDESAMPSTETIVAELRRLDRVAILRQAAEAIEREQAREERAERERFGYLDHETELQGVAVRAKATFLRRLADDVERGKDTSVGSQPTAGGATPDFFLPGHTYRRRRWRFQCLAVGPDPATREARAAGFLYRPGESATVTGMDPETWARGGWCDITELSPATDAPAAHPDATAHASSYDTDTEGTSQ
jgi:hypothetical protein